MPINFFIQIDPGIFYIIDSHITISLIASLLFQIFPTGNYKIIAKITKVRNYC
jgi:hypothetical protein